MRRAEREGGQAGESPACAAPPPRPPGGKLSREFVVGQLMSVMGMSRPAAEAEYERQLAAAEDRRGRDEPA